MLSVVGFRESFSTPPPRDEQAPYVLEAMGALGIEEDWWLYVVLFAALFILLAVNSYIIVIWQHPDDKNEAYFPKAVVVSYNIPAAAAFVGSCALGDATLLALEESWRAGSSLKK